MVLSMSSLRMLYSFSPTFPVTGIYESLNKCFSRDEESQAETVYKFQVTQLPTSRVRIRPNIPCFQSP